MLSLSRALRWLTVEPTTLLSCLMMTLSNVVQDNLFIEKVCRLDLAVDAATCRNYTAAAGPLPDATLTRLQSRVAELHLWDGVLISAPAVLLCLFAGPWSDLRGRKRILIMPIVGFVLYYLIYIVQYVYFDTFDSNSLLIASAVQGFFGGYQCLNLGLYGYVSDITDLESRTTRMSILNGAFSLGFIIGPKVGALVYTATSGNYVIIFGGSIVLGLLTIGHVLFVLEESVKTSTTTTRTTSTTRTTTTSSTATTTRITTTTSKLGLFDPRHLKTSLGVLVLKESGVSRVRLLLLVLHFSVFILPISSSAYDYLLAQLVFDWRINEYSTFLTLQRICRVTSLWILLPILSQVVRLSDGLIAVTGTLVAAMAYTLMAVGRNHWLPIDALPNGWPFLLSAMLQLNSVVTVTIRSQCTKSVGVHASGRIFAVVAFVQALVPVLANPVFSVVYQNTLDTHVPGAYLLILVALLLLVACTSGAMFANDGWSSHHQHHLVHDQREEDQVGEEGERT